MKRVILLSLLLAVFTGCENMENDFPDYDLQAVYFPLQLPLRTLSLGEDRMDNSLDRELKFDIGVSVGGMYENNTDWTVDYIVDTTLVRNVVNAAGKPLKVLPPSYYTLNPKGTVTIPRGSFSGLIRVQLNPEFLNDPVSMTGEYVIPLRLIDTSADSILQGKPATGVVNPDRRVVLDWEAGKAPKDWVMFGIKYVNAFHGSYIHRGRNVRLVNNVPAETTVYSTKFLVDNRIIKLTTAGKDMVRTDAISNIKTGAKNYSMQLNFANTNGKSGPVTITPVAGSTYSVTGTGQFFDLADSKETYSQLKFQSMHLQYTYTDGPNVHQVSDTLVFRDRGIVFEELKITITP